MVNGMGTSAQNLSIDDKILMVANITKEISGVDEQASNFYYSFSLLGYHISLRQVSVSMWY